MEKSLKGNLRGLELFKAWVIPIIMIVSTLFLCFNSRWSFLNDYYKIIAMIVFIYLFAKVALDYFRFTGLMKMIGGLELDAPFNNACTYGGIIQRIIVGNVLSLVTIGFYYPWYMDKMIAYLSVNTTYENESLDFKGDPSELLVKMVVFLFIMVISILGNVYIVGNVANILTSVYSANFIVEAITDALQLFSSIGMTLYVLQYGMNVSYKGNKMTIEKSFVQILFFVFINMYLAKLTYGLYLPLALIFIYKYFIKELRFTNGNSLRFDGHLGKGFFSIFGHLVLSLLTIGVYLPWAIANIFNWFIDHTYIVGQFTNDGAHQDKTVEEHNIEQIELA